MMEDREIVREEQFASSRRRETIHINSFFVFPNPIPNHKQHENSENPDTTRSQLLEHSAKQASFNAS